MAVVFDATGDRYSGTTAPSTFTILCWIRIDSDRDTWQRFWSITGDYQYFGTAEDGVSINYSSTASGESTTVLTATVGTWYRTAVIKNGSALTLYAGAAGAAMSTTTDTGATTTPDEFAIGGSVGNATEWFNGSIANFKMYSTVLTLAEIENELAQYQPVNPTGLIRWHPFLVAETVNYAGTGTALTAGSTATTTDTNGPPIRWGRSRATKVSTSGPTLKSVSDSFALSETAEILVTHSRVDDFSLVDDATSIAIATTDGINLLEALSGQVSTTDNDEIVLQEVVAGQFATIASDEIVVAVEDTDILQLTNFSGTDTFNLTDTAQLSITEIRSGLDTFALTETASAIQQQFATASDLFGLNETAEIQAFIEVDDFIVINEIEDLTIIVSIAEQIIVTEFVDGISAGLSATDIYRLIEFADNGQVDLPNYIYGSVIQLNIRAGDARMVNQIDATLIETNHMAADFSTTAIMGDVIQD